MRATDTTRRSEPDGHSEMPEAGCASVECHGWETLARRYHQASDMSLNLWILMPHSAGPLGVSRRLSKGGGMRAPRSFSILCCWLSIWWRRTRRADGSALSTNILGRASSCSWLPMLWRAVKGLGGRGRWAQRVLNGALLVALAFCVVSGAMVSGTLLPSLGFYATGYYFWGPLHALSAKVLLAAPARPYCLAHAGCRIRYSVELARENEWRSFGELLPSLSRSSAP